MNKATQTEARPSRRGGAATAVTQSPFERILRRGIRRYLAPVGMAVLGVLVVFLIVLAVKKMRQHRAEAAALALAQASTVEQLDEVASMHHGTVAATEAALRVARLLYQEGRYAHAAAKFSVFCNDYPTSPLVEAARLGEAYALEADGKLIQAETRFAEIAAAALKQELSVDAYTSAGRCAQAQGKLSEARKWYQRALDGDAPAFVKERLRDMLEALSQAPTAGSPAVAAENTAAVAGDAPQPAAPEAQPDEPTGAAPTPATP